MSQYETHCPVICEAVFVSLSPDLRKKIDGRNILYRLDTLYENMRFGWPTNFRVIETVAFDDTPSRY